MTIIEPLKVPGNMTVLQAMAQGFLPADVQVVAGGSGQNPTLHQALASGRISHSTLCSQLTFIGGANAVYGGS